MAEVTDDRPPFKEIVKAASDIVIDSVTNDWSRIAKLNEVDALVYLKNTEGVIVYGNETYLANMSRDGSPIGRPSDAFLDKSIIEVSRQTDGLIISGTLTLDCEHSGRGIDGRLWLLRTHKRNLASLGNPGLAILGITRLERLLEEDDPHPRAELAEQSRRFRALDEIDRSICRQIGRGQKVREIAEELSLTSRAVEQRKKKILDVFELEQTLDLIKLLVRLQDRGFVDLGI